MSWLWNALNYVPIVGTAKNTVEAIVAVGQGDGREAFSKGTQAVVGGVLDAFTFGAAGSISKITLKEGAKQSGKVVAKKVVSNAASSYTMNIATRWSYAQLTQNRRRIRHQLWPREFTVHMHSVDQRPSRRGEHVINNSVLRVNRDIVESFVSSVLGDNLWEMIDSERLSEGSSVYEAIMRPLPGRIMDIIQNGLVVFPDANEMYQDSNAVSYGRQIEILRNAVVVYMEAVFRSIEYEEDSTMISRYERNIRDTVEDFIAGNYFVDDTALDLWLQDSRHDRNTFERAHSEVVKMFRRLIYDDGNDEVIQWVKDLRDARNM